MFAISSREILSLQGDSDAFTRFVDSLIYVSAHSCDKPVSEISTNQRTNIPDGGVDTKVSWKTDVAWLDWFDFPTCWQYKATARRNIHPTELKKEIKKPFVRKLIQDRYAYRFCICDTLPSSRKEEWERILWEEIAQINDKAPKPKVVTADDLSHWTNNFPGIIIRFFKPALKEILHIKTWGDSVTQLTPQFVFVQEWEDVWEAILDHVAIKNTPLHVVLPLQGEAGVGKTRLVYECLNSQKALGHLVLYVLDEDVAVKVAATLANDPQARAILVADECSQEKRSRLNSLLGGSKDRIRVVTIDNAWDRELSWEPKYWLTKIPDTVMEEIAEKNFPNVPRDRRRIYLNLAKGYVRFVAYLCMYDNEIRSSGYLEPALNDICESVSIRIGREKLETLEALSLFQKVGFRGKFGNEVGEVCKFLNLETTQFIKNAKSLRDVPGFVGFAGRYLYVTPEVIAVIAFEKAWERWIEMAPTDFFQSLPKSLKEPFLKRVAKSAREEHRRIVGKFFRNWFAFLNPEDLSDVEKVQQMEILVTIRPDRYLPMLRELIESATTEHLMRDADYPSGGNTRRILVWLAEKFSWFPEHFNDSESILLRLALAETEPGIGNNATEIWKQLFRIYPSGTSTPFSERIVLLERRLFSNDVETSKLSIDALNQIFNLRNVRFGGEEFIAGRIIPEEWYPESLEEREKCLEAAVELLLKMAESEREDLRTGAVNIAIENMRMLLSHKHLDKLKELFSYTGVPDETLPKLIEAVDDFLYFECKKDSYFVQTGYEKRVSDWISNLVPGDYHGKLVSVVGVDQWHYELRERKQEWERQINELAEELCSNSALLSTELPWLCSDEAKSAAVLGDAVGRCDKECRHMERILRAALETEYTIFAKGYLYGLLQEHPHHSTKLNELLDKIEKQNPRVAYELFIMGGETTKAFERTMKLVEAGILEETYFGSFLRGFNRENLSLERFCKILKRLLPKIHEGSIEVCRLAIDGIAMRLYSEKKKSQQLTIRNDDVQPLVWEILESTQSRNRVEAYWWREILEEMLEIDTERTIALACRALFGQHYAFKEEAEKLLSRIAPEYSQQIMNQLGYLLMDKESARRLFITRLVSIFQKLQPEVVIKWLDETGVEGARSIARHLPAPYINENDEPTLHPLTKFVIEKFGGDERVFSEFCAGIHSFRTYVGDISEIREKDAQLAKRFLNYPLPKIREWARREEHWAEEDAKRWREENEEYWLR